MPRPTCTGWGSAPQWFRGKYRQARADLVRVRAGKVTRQINAVMRRGGSISGVVTGQRGTRLSRVCVTAVTADRKQFVAQAKTVRGRYRIKALDAGRYRVYFDPACGYHATRYLDQWWPAASTVKASKPVTVRLGAVTRRVNAALRLGGTIAGTVRFENSQGRPLAGICVFGLGLGPVSSVEQDGVTKKNGTFVLQGLPGGRYKLEFGAVGCGNNGNYLYYSARPAGLGGPSSLQRRGHASTRHRPPIRTKQHPRDQPGLVAPRSRASRLAVCADMRSRAARLRCGLNCRSGDRHHGRDAHAHREHAAPHWPALRA